MGHEPMDCHSDYQTVEALGNDTYLSDYGEKKYEETPLQGSWSWLEEMKERTGWQRSPQNESHMDNWKINFIRNYGTEGQECMLNVWNMPKPEGKLLFLDFSYAK